VSFGDWLRKRVSVIAISGPHALLLAFLTSLCVGLYLRQANDQGKVVLDSRFANSSLPSLSTKQANVALRITKDYLELNHFSAYSLTGEAVEPWTTSSGFDLGALVTLTLQRPVTLQGKWLSMRYDCLERSLPPYTVREWRGSWEGVRSVLALVDLSRNQVVEVHPTTGTLRSPSSAPTMSSPPGCS